MRGNKIASLWHAFLALLVTCAKEVQFYCPSHTYEAIPNCTIFLIFRALCILLLLLFQVATPNMRGSLAVIPAVAGTLGLLTTQVLGAYLNWQWLSIVCAGLNVPFLLMLIFIPESPVYLISTEQIERAHKILRVLRGNLQT